MNIWEDLKFKFLHNPSAVNKLLMINVGVFVVASIIRMVFYFFSYSAEPLFDFLYLPDDFSLFLMRPWTIVTYQFMHTRGISHILFNMLVLFFMGNILEDFLGSKKIWITYFGGGLAGAFLFLIAYNFFPVFANIQALLLGASAGVMAITAATATLVPEYEVMLFGFFRIKLKWLALGLILVNIVSIPASNPGGGIAHLGGAIFGMLYIFYIKGPVTNPFIKFFNNFNKMMPKSNKVDEKKIYREKVYSNNESKKANSKPNKRNGRPNQDEIDAILDKISHSGYNSLTSEEKEILFRASE